jgi:hypothetical protein
MLKGYIKKYKGIVTSANNNNNNGAGNETAFTGTNSTVKTAKPNADGESNRPRSVTASVVDGEKEFESEIPNTSSNINDSNVNAAAAFEDECKNSKLKLTICSNETIKCSLKDFIAKFIADDASYSLKM